MADHRLAQRHPARRRARRVSVAVLVVAAFGGLAACQGAGTTGSGAAGSPSAVATPSRPDPTPEPTSGDASPGAESPTAGPATQPPPSEPAGAVLTQPWATATLTDVRTGAAFRIADLVAEGRVVFLETMAIWCTKCRAQQEEAVVAMTRLDPARVTWVGIDVESSESAEALARYSEQHGFDFSYAIANADLARALVAEFGDTILNPPSVNVVVIGSDGRITAGRGHKTADEIVTLASEHGA
jgi:hypothetical protein